MPRFFFDVFDGEKLWADTEGTEHDDVAAARHEAVDTITSISRETFPQSGPGSISIDIRPEDGPAVERLIVSLSVHKL